MNSRVCASIHSVPGITNPLSEPDAADSVLNLVLYVESTRVQVRFGPRRNQR